MIKNRKNQSVSLRFGSSIKALVLCLVIGGVGIGYVGQKSQLYVLGSQYRELENKLVRIRRENFERARALDSMLSPPELDARVKQMKLGLIAPRPEQIIRLAEHISDSTVKSANRLYAEHKSLAADRP
jgi:hypothetical protein